MYNKRLVGYNLRNYTGYIVVKRENAKEIISLIIDIIITQCND